MDPYDVFAEKYRQCVLDVAKKYISHLEKDELLNMKQQFEIWKKEPDKLNVNNLYTLSGWRALYTQNLFMSRISTMLLTFRQVLMQPHVFEIMKCIKRVVSIGCGPGPDIAAVLMLLRNNIGVSHFVKVIGIDQFIGWRQYVLSLNKVDLNGTNNSIEFWQLRVEEKTLDKVLSAEMCVMSYTDAAIHTQKFWQGLKQKFSLIVILDQKKGSLTRLLRRENFRMVEYEYKGTKRFFYWVDPRGVKESLSHVSSRMPNMGERHSMRASGRDGSRADMGSGKADHGGLSDPHSTTCHLEENGEEEDDEDEDDDNSEQQRELAAIFDRLGDIGKMPVAQLNELDEVQKIRNELCRTADAAKDSTTLAMAVKPKQSYRSALEPQKHLSKERKNQLLKAKLRELGVESDNSDDEDDDEDDVDNKDEDVETPDSVNNDEYHDNVSRFCGNNHITPLNIDLSDPVHIPKPPEEGLPILCISSATSPLSGSAIPIVDRLTPAYSPPIIIPPLNIQLESPFQTSPYPIAFPPAYIHPDPYATSSQFCEAMLPNPETNIMSSSAIPIISQSFNRNDTAEDDNYRNKRNYLSLKRPTSLVLLSNSSDEAAVPLKPNREAVKSSSRPNKYYPSCLGPLENHRMVNPDAEPETKRFKGPISSRLKPPVSSINRAADETRMVPEKQVTDLREVLNNRRKYR